MAVIDTRSALLMTDPLASMSVNQEREQFELSETFERAKANGQDPHIAYEINAPPLPPETLKNRSHEVDENELLRNTEWDDSEVPLEYATPEQHWQQPGVNFNRAARIVHDWFYQINDYEHLAAAKYGMRVPKGSDWNVTGEFVSDLEINRPPLNQSFLAQNDAEYSQFGLEWIGHLLYSDVGMLGAFMQSDENTPREVLMAQAALMDVYDKLPPFTFKGSTRLFKNLVMNPSTFAGLGSLKVFKNLLAAGGKGAIGENTYKRLLSLGLGATAIAAEGAGWAGFATYIDQKVKHGSTRERGAAFEADWGQIGAASAVGFGLAGGLTFGIAAAPLARQGAGKLRQTVQDMAAEGGATTRMGVGPTDDAAARAAPQDDISEIGFYSAVRRAVDALPQDKGTAIQMRQMIAKGEGVKPEEMAWIGLDDFLKGRKNVTKQEIMDFVDANQVEVKEVVKSQDAVVFDTAKKATADEIDLIVNNDEGLYQNINELQPLIEKLREATSAEYDDVASELGDALVAAGASPARVKRWVFDDFESNVSGATAQYRDFEQYTLPGGENYREVALTLPERRGSGFDKKRYDELNKKDVAGKLRDPQEIEEFKRLMDESVANRRGKGFTGGHLEIPNTLAHVRLNDRTGPNGEKILFVEEIQSDWHQKGRKQGYKTGEARFDLESNRWVNPDGTPAAEIPTRGVPDAPLKKTWHEMAFRRIARMAAEEGYDMIAWTPGKIQAERYDLSKQVDTIRVEKLRDGAKAGQYYVTAEKDGTSAGIAEVVTEDKLPELIGKDLADKAIKDAAEYPDGRDYTGVDLQVGGEGMAGFYDKMLKTYAGKFGKKFNAKVGVTEIDTGIRSDLSGIHIIEHNGKWTVRDRVNGGSLADFNNKADAESYVAGLEIQTQRESTPEVWTLPVTKKMRDSLMQKGAPLFSAAPIAAAGLAGEERTE